MEILIFSVIVAILWFAISVVWNLVKSVHPTTPGILSLVNNKGYAWFFGLLFLNLALTAFIIGYYYYKTQVGVGPAGPRGYPGLEGDRVVINTK